MSWYNETTYLCGMSALKSISKMLFIIYIMMTSQTAFSALEGDSLRSLKLLGGALSNVQTQPDSALYYSDEVLKIQGVTGSNVNHINALTLKGIVYKNKGFYDLASDAYVKALNKAINSNDYARVSVCLNNIGVIYKTQKNYEQALFYFQKSLEIEKNLDNELQLSIRHYNLGEVYLEMDSLSLAELYFTNSLIIEEQNENLEGIIYGNYGLGLIETKRNNFKAAHNRLEFAKNELKSLDSELGFNILNAIGSLHLKESNIDAAINCLEIVNKSPKKNEFTTIWMESAHNLAKAYAKKGNFQKAYKYATIHDSLNIVLSKSISNQKIEELSYLYDLEQKQRKIDLLEFNQRKIEVKEKLNKDIIVFIISSILFVIGAVIIRIRQVKS